MSLLGALNLGSTSLAAQQVGLQVTGNNITNANTPGYSREVANFGTLDPTEVGNNLSIGNGSTVTSIERQVDESVNSSLRDANAAQQQASTLNTYLGQIQTTFGTLNDNDLSSQLAGFFNSFSTLATNPQDEGQRSVVVQGGATLASYIQGLRSQMTSIRSSADSQIGTLAGQANQLLSGIATLNQQITTSEGSGATANTLRDQRDSDLSQLSQIMDIHTVENSNGMVNVFEGSQTLVQGTVSSGLTTVQATDPTGTYNVTGITTQGSPAQSINPTGGEIGGLITTRDVHATGAINALDQIASSLINAVNSVHSQGQGLDGFSSLTGATAVLDPTLALNSSTTATGLPTAPTSGTFDINITNASTGQTTTKQIAVDFSGSTPTTLNSLAAAISGSGLAASVDSSGHLNIQSTSANNTFTFSNDTSGVVSSLGLNTFFTGTNASNIGVNQTVTTNPDFVATGQNGVAGSNANALALAQGFTTVNTQLGGQSLQNFYSNYVGQLATTAAAVSDDNTAQTTIQQTLTAQQQSVSGVSIDEEAINLTRYQRAFQGSAQYISVVDQMMQTVLAMIPAG